MIDFKQKMQETERKERRNQSDWHADEALINNKKRKRIVTYIIAIVVVSIIFSGRIIMSSQDSANWLPGATFFGKIKGLVSSSDKELEGEKNDRINVLLLGMGGSGHDGAYLADTIMLASIQPSTKQVALISIPRDLAGPIDNSGVWKKINNINAYAEARKKGSGGEATTKALGSLFQIPIEYYVRADFEGFVKVIDELGGIEVFVENTFDDYTYPIEGEEDNPDYYSRFEHLHFDEGKQKLNGSLALKYARSRHAIGIEGSDFARAKRQQIILEAVKSKLLSRQTLLNPVMLGKLVNQFNQHVDTNLKVWEMLKLWDMGKEVDKLKIQNIVLSDSPLSYLTPTIGEDGAFLLIPRTGNFSELRNMVQNVFYVSDGKTEKKEAVEDVKPVGEDSKVVIVNGTWITGLASKTSNRLEQYQYKIVEVGNAPTRDYEEAVIYDLTYGDKNIPLREIEKLSGAEQAFGLPEWVKEYDNITDFVLILGTNSK